MRIRAKLYIRFVRQKSLRRRIDGETDAIHFWIVVYRAYNRMINNVIMIRKIRRIIRRRIITIIYIVL